MGGSRSGDPLCSSLSLYPFQCLLKYLVKNVDDELKVELAAHAAYYEHRLRRGSKPIYHLEAFVAKVMSVYKRYLMQMFM